MANETREQLQAQIGDDYHLQWIIGHGGMSTVWLADDIANEREVAIKVLRPEFSNNDEFLDRFRNEAQAAESIESDNVVATYDYREIPDPAGHTNCFIAMEYVRGESLADLLAREGKLSEDIALDVLEQAAHGLSKIHRMNLIHRDLKPGNLMITQNGQVKITDFGIAKAAAAVPLTRTGMVVGTAQYVSPEQAQGYSVTSATDVYSLGVVGYEMLAGERPFTGDSGVSVALAHVNNAPPALTTSISAEARELIGIALRKDPNTRFADGNELQLAAAAVRAGNRPPQPASAAMNQLAEEPSPTASTHMLGQVAQPTTVHPAASMAGAGAAGAGAAGAAGAAAARANGTAVTPGKVPSPGNRRKKNSGGGGFGIGVLIAAIIVVGGGLIVWALVQSGVISPTTTEPTPTEEPTIVTEWVTPTEETEEPTTEIHTTTVVPTDPATEQEPTNTLAPPPLTTDSPEPPPSPTDEPTEVPSPPEESEVPPPSDTPPGDTDAPIDPSAGGGTGQNSDGTNRPSTPGEQLGNDLEQLLGGN